MGVTMRASLSPGQILRPKLLREISVHAQLSDHFLGSKDQPQQQPVTTQLPPLPYPYDHLEPVIPQSIMRLHHGAHHLAYSQNTNKLLAQVTAEKAVGDPLGLKKFNKESSLNSKLHYGHVIKAFNPQLYFNFGGFINHALLWNFLTNETRLKKLDSSCGALEKAIVDSFGSVEQMKSKMKSASLALIGSGWSWLVLDPQSRDKSRPLSICTTANQDTPFDQLGLIPIFGIDMWEHAYYLKYFNNKADYLDSIWQVVNWSFVSTHFENIQQGFVATDR